jgi:hypothetical protein
MRRGFVYSLAALALALAVAQAAILFSTPSGISYGHDSKADVMEFAAFSEGEVGMRSALLESCGLAEAAANGYERSANVTFSNKSCVLSFLVRDGNVTADECPGESFSLLETSNKLYSLSSWRSGSGMRNTGIIVITGRLLSVYASENGTHTACSSSESVIASALDNSTSLSRTYAATRTVANPSS